MVRCPQTKLTIPECCCAKCLDEQVRKAAPALLEQEGAVRSGRVPDSRGIALTRRAA
jgi:hypothetical protein